MSVSWNLKVWLHSPRSIFQSQRVPPMSEDGIISSANRVLTMEVHPFAQ
jgi:hypothetical protein